MMARAMARFVFCGVLGILISAQVSTANPNPDLNSHYQQLLASQCTPKADCEGCTPSGTCDEPMFVCEERSCTVRCSQERPCEGTSLVATRSEETILECTGKHTCKGMLVRGAGEGGKLKISCGHQSCVEMKVSPARGDLDLTCQGESACAKLSLQEGAAKGKGSEKGNNQKRNKKNKLGTEQRSRVHVTCGGHKACEGALLHAPLDGLLEVSTAEEEEEHVEDGKPGFAVMRELEVIAARGSTVKVSCDGEGSEESCARQVISAAEARMLTVRYGEGFDGSVVECPESPLEHIYKAKACKIELTSDENPLEELTIVGLPLEKALLQGATTPPAVVHCQGANGCLGRALEVRCHGDRCAPTEEGCFACENLHRTGGDSGGCAVWPLCDTAPHGEEEEEEEVSEEGAPKAEKSVAQKQERLGTLSRQPRAYYDSPNSTVYIGSLACGDVKYGNTDAANHLYDVDFASVGTGITWNFDTCGSYTDFDTMLSLWERLPGGGGGGGGDPSYVRVAQNDDGCPGWRSYLSVNVPEDVDPVKDYVLLVGGWSSETGNYELNVECENGTSTWETTAWWWWSSTGGYYANCWDARYLCDPADPYIPTRLNSEVLRMGDVKFGNTFTERQMWAIDWESYDQFYFYTCGYETDYDSGISIWLRLPDGNYSLVAADDLSCGLRSEVSIYVPLEIDTSGDYFLLLGGWSYDTGNFRLTVDSAPSGSRGSNGSLFNATDAPECYSSYLCPPDSTFHATTFEGNIRVGDTVHGETDTGRRYWQVRFGGDTEGMYHFSTCRDTDYDSGISFWVLLASGEYDLVDANDDTCGLRSALAIDLEDLDMSRPHFILVGGFYTDTGHFTLSVSEDRLWTTWFSYWSTESGSPHCYSSFYCAPDDPYLDTDYNGVLRMGDEEVGTTEDARQYWRLDFSEGDFYAYDTCIDTYYDSGLSIWKLEGRNYTMVAVNDDWCGLRSYLSVNVPLLDTSFAYYLLVGGFGRSKGEFTLRVSSSRNGTLTTWPPYWSTEEVEEWCFSSYECAPDNSYFVTEFKGALRVGHRVGGTTEYARQFWKVDLEEERAETYSFDTCADPTDYDSGLSLWRWDEVEDDYVLVAENDDDCWLQSRIIVYTGDLMLDQDHFILVAGFGSSRGHFILSVRANYTESSTQLPLTTAPSLGDAYLFAPNDPTAGLTLNKGVLGMGDDVVDNTNAARLYWRIFFGDETETFYFSTCYGSDFDTGLSLWERKPGNVYDLITANDNACGIYSEVSINPERYSASGDVFLLIAGANGQRGDFHLQVTSFSLADGFVTTPSIGGPYMQPPQDDTYGEAFFQGIVEPGDVVSGRVARDRRLYWQVDVSSIEDGTYDGALFFSLCFGSATDSGVSLWLERYTEVTLLEADASACEGGTAGEVEVSADELRAESGFETYVLVGGKVNGVEGDFTLSVTSCSLATGKSAADCPGIDTGAGRTSDAPICGKPSFVGVLVSVFAFVVLFS